MNDKEIMDLLHLVRTTLQTSYPDQTQSKNAIAHLLNVVDEAALKVSGQRIIKRHRTFLESVIGAGGVIPK